MGRRLPGHILAPVCSFPRSNSCRPFANQSNTSATPILVAPFRRSQDEAIIAVVDFCNSQWLAPRVIRSASLIRQIRAVFIPFWACDVHVDSTAEAEVGFPSSRQDHRRGAAQSTPGLYWTRTTRTRSIRRHYPIDLPEMQIYAGYDQRRANVQVLKMPLSAARPLGAESMLGQEVEPFAMHRSLADERIIGYVEAVERRWAERELLHATGASAIRNVRVRFERIQRSWRRLYFPAFILAYQHLASDFAVVVNGFNGKVFGVPQFSPYKVAMAVSGPITLFLHTLNSSLNLPIYILSVVLPSILLGLVARMLPVHIARRRDQQRFDEQSKTSASTADVDGDGDDEARSNRSRREQRYRDRYSASGRPKSSKLYARLGVSNTASLDEISRAFRAMALKYHPDVGGKEPDSGERFRDIVAAYQTLRDPEKRAVYDQTGQQR